MIFDYQDNSKLLYTNQNNMENLWKGVILAEEVIKFLPDNKYYIRTLLTKQSYDITPLLR